jgi:hypothetical protein
MSRSESTSAPDPVYLCHPLGRIWHGCRGTQAQLLAVLGERRASPSACPRAAAHGYGQITPRKVWCAISVL